MRRALVPLDAEDAAELERELDPLVVPYRVALPTYEGIAR